MSQQFACKEPNCPEKFDYERKVIPAWTVNLDPVRVAKKEIVYLTCAKGHTYPYEVGVET